MISIVSCNGGYKNLEAVRDSRDGMLSLGFSIDQMITLAARRGGSIRLLAACEYGALMLSLGFRLDEIVSIALRRTSNPILSAISGRKKKKEAACIA